MNKHFFLAIALAALLAVSQAAAQEKDVGPAKDDKLVYAELAKAPEKARSKHNPLENNRDSVAAGRILFARHCAECHGETAEGGKKAPSLRAAEVQNAQPGAIFWILTNGVVRRGMPVWSKLPEPQRWQLIVFIKSLGVSSASPVAPAPNQVPTALKEPSSPPR